MANDDKKPTAAEKGKAKANEVDVKDKSQKPEEVKKDKDGKPIANGKKDEEPKEGESLHHGVIILVRPHKSDDHDTNICTMARGAE